MAKAQGMRWRCRAVFSTIVAVVLAFHALQQADSLRKDARRASSIAAHNESQGHPKMTPGRSGRSTGPQGGERKRSNRRDVLKTGPSKVMSSIRKVAAYMKGETKDVCAKLDCAPNGDCNLDVTPPVCRCYAGWIGPSCKRNLCDDVDYCEPNGRCDSTSGEARCACDARWSGEKCDHDKCSLVACNENQYCTIMHSAAVCMCLPGWTGPYCQEKDDTHDDSHDDSQDVCAKLDCAPNGDCNTEVTPAVCRCYAGWIGPSCKENLCDDVNCEPNGRCDSTSGKAVCRCNSGWEGPTCSEKSK